MGKRNATEKPTVLAVASGGGHWVQLNRIAPAFDDCRVVFVSTRRILEQECGDADFYLVPDANRWNKWDLVRSAIAMLWVVLKVRPSVVVTTGAAPGYFAIRLGKLVGAKSIFIDSIANAEVMSLSGQRALKVADVCFTQWEHLAAPTGPIFRGNVIG